MDRSRDTQGQAWTDTLPLTTQPGAGGGEWSDRARKPQVPRNKVSSQRNPRPESRGPGLVQSYTALGYWALGELLEEHNNKKQTVLQVMQVPADKSASYSGAASHR